jgi:hypothetical protein
MYYTCLERTLNVAELLRSVGVHDGLPGVFITKESKAGGKYVHQGVKTPLLWILGVLILVHIFGIIKFFGKTNSDAGTKY